LEIVLASTSRYRRALLDSLGLRYRAMAPAFEEDHALAIPPEEMVIRFARAKAESLGPACPEAAIVGCDQLAAVDGKVLTKPGSEARAVEQLLALGGRTHQLLTAIALHRPRAGITEHAVVVHKMKMRPLTPALAEAYVARDRPLDCAGAYKVESLGIALFEEMLGDDHTAIIGLPITRLVWLLKNAGIELLESVLENARCARSAPAQ
jgi:septum formation protein